MTPITELASFHQPWAFLSNIATIFCVLPKVQLSLADLLNVLNVFVEFVSGSSKASFVRALCELHTVR